MDLSLKNLGAELQGRAQSIIDTAADNVNKLLDDFNEALPTMRALGFTVTNFRLNMAIPPELLLTLVAAADSIDPARIDQLIKANPDKKFLITILKALQAAYQIKKQLGDAMFKSIDLDITLGLSPKIAVRFGTN